MEGLGCARNTLGGVKYVGNLSRDLGVLGTLWMGQGVWTPCVGTEVFCVTYGDEWIPSSGTKVFWVPYGRTGHVGTWWRG